MYRWQVSKWKDAPCYKSSRKCKLTQRDNITHLWEWPKFTTLTIPNVSEDVKQQELSFIAGENAKWNSHIMTVWWFLMKLNILLPYDPAILVSWYLPKWTENLCPQKNQHMDVNSSFIHNCQNLEATEMCFSRWVDKLWSIQTMEYYSALKRNKLSSHEKTWRNLKCISPSERNQSEKATKCTITTIWHSWKGRTMETVERLVVIRI